MVRQASGDPDWSGAAEAAANAAAAGDGDRPRRGEATRPPEAQGKTDASLRDTSRSFDAPADALPGRQYFLRTERLGFGTWSAADLPLARALWGDARVTALIGGPFADDWIRDRLAREISNQAAFGYQYWPIFRLGDDAHVGCCGLRPVPGKDETLELGFHLRFEHWGRGYATEAAQAAIGHAFGTLGADALVAGHNPRNDPSRRVLLRLGFRYAGDQFYPPTGLHHPSYELTAEEFAAAR